MLSKLVNIRVDELCMDRVDELCMERVPQLCPHGQSYVHHSMWTDFIDSVHGQSIHS